VHPVWGKDSLRSRCEKGFSHQRECEKGFSHQRWAGPCGVQVRERILAPARHSRFHAQLRPWSGLSTREARNPPMTAVTGRSVGVVESAS